MSYTFQLTWLHVEFLKTYLYEVAPSFVRQNLQDHKCN